MDLTFTREENQFREEVREWLNANVPKEPRPHEGGGPAERAYDLEWQRTQYKGGWAGINWPEAYGGRGLTTHQQLIWHEEYARANAPEIGICFVGINHAGPTLIARANEAQKREHLPQILRGDVIWCQGFSEPGAGSDLANISTRARIEGDMLVVNGQKIWTSYAQHAQYQELVVRTDPDSQRSKGLSWVICDMSTPGIDIRPIQMINGDRHFCEVFYDEVKIPIENVVGEIGQGWSVAMSTLAFERGTAFTAQQVSLAYRIERLIELAKETPRPGGNGRAIDDDDIAHRLGKLRAEVAALRAMTYVNISRLSRTGVPGAGEGSMTKIFLGAISQESARLAVEILGPRALIRAGTNAKDDWSAGYLRSYAATVGGGTTEIQHEIVAERLLGLPRAR